MTIRIHELAKRHNIEGRELLALLKERGVIPPDYRSVSSTLSGSQVLQTERILTNVSERTGFSRQSDSLYFDQLHKRLPSLPDAARILFAARCALRVLPLCTERFKEIAIASEIGLSDGIAPCSMSSVERASVALAAANGAAGAVRADDSASAAAAAAAFAADTVAASAAREDFSESFKLSAFHDSEVSMEDAFNLKKNSLDKAVSALNAAAACARYAHKAIELSKRPIPTPARISRLMLADLKAFEAEKTATPQTYYRLAELPLWPEAPSGSIDKYLSRWLRAFRENSKGDPKAEAMARRIEGYHHGRWDWVGLLGPETAAKLIAAAYLPLPPPRALSAALAHLAYEDPKLLQLLASPDARLAQPDFRRRWTDRAHAEASASPSGTDFQPDPVWLAWYQAAHPDALAPSSSPFVPERAAALAHELITSPYTVDYLNMPDKTFGQTPSTSILEQK